MTVVHLPHGLLAPQMPPNSQTCLFSPYRLVFPSSWVNQGLAALIHSVQLNVNSASQTKCYISWIRDHGKNRIPVAKWDSSGMFLQRKVGISFPFFTSLPYSINLSVKQQFKMFTKYDKHKKVLLCNEFLLGFVYFMCMLFCLYICRPKEGIGSHGTAI